MTWKELGLWADEQQRILMCITDALGELIDQGAVEKTDEELRISGRLRPLLQRKSKENRLDWTLHSESSTFERQDDSTPSGHPDFRLSRRDTSYKQYDYDIECKLIRTRRQNSETDYCYLYVRRGIRRFHEGRYAQSTPPMGAILGYIQEGTIRSLIEIVNERIKNQQEQHEGIGLLQLDGDVMDGNVSRLTEELLRVNDEMVLYHLWADLR